MALLASIRSIPKNGSILLNLPAYLIEDPSSKDLLICSSRSLNTVEQATEQIATEAIQSIASILHINECDSCSIQGQRIFHLRQIWLKLSAD